MQQAESEPEKLVDLKNPIHDTSHMTYVVTKGTHAKVITLEATPKVQDWITKNHHSFSAGLISNLVMNEKINLARRNPSTSGYALFGGDSGTDNKARYILAVPYYKIQITKD